MGRSPKSRARRAPAPAIPRKPMAMTRRVSLFEREVKVKLAPLALELLHDAARVLSEGDMDGNVYAGSTMLTIDLAKTATRVSDPPDASTAQRIAMLYPTDERFRNHAKRIAVTEAVKTAGCDLTAPHIDVESRSRGAELHLSLNVEAHRRNQ
jgi:hypothetical protein